MGVSDSTFPVNNASDIDVNGTGRTVDECYVYVAMVFDEFDEFHTPLCAPHGHGDGGGLIEQSQRQRVMGERWFWVAKRQPQNGI